MIQLLFDTLIFDNRNLKHALTRILSVLIFQNAVAQNINPGTDAVFRPNEVAKIILTLAPTDKAALLDPANENSSTYYAATFRMINSQYDITLDYSVGVRLRGNTSRYHSKKSFKIDFREFGGTKFFDYKKFNLKPNVNDPSAIREPLTLQFYRNMNVPAARTHPLELYMNDEYMGFYTHVENIDDEFLDKRFGHEDGYLYKCSWGSTLEDNGQVENTTQYESEINQPTDNRAQLKNFVFVLNKSYSTTADFQAAIESVFDVDRYLRQLAVEAMLGHWDGYSYNKNNFYIYYNAQTQLIEFIPYDGDNTWGIDWVNRDWATRDLNNWAKTDEPRPLTKKLLQVPAYKEKYSAYLRALATSYFNENYLMPILNEYKNMVSASVNNDTYFDDAFGFTYTTFLNSFTSNIPNSHVDYGIKEYLDMRLAYAINQIPGLITAVEEGTPSGFIYPNPSALPMFKYSSTYISSTPLVYSITGVLQKITFSNQETEIQISLPTEASRGIYLVHINGEIIRWLYK
jgi:hypothetical protein